ncbi:MAG: ABC transporter permease [Christensenellaceae bacterium]
MIQSIKKVSWRNAVKNLYVYGILLLFVIIFWALSPKFLSIASVNNILRTAAPLVITSAAATLLMLSGNVDLSVGSILGFSGVLFATFCKIGIATPISAILVAIVGIGIGIINGFIVVKLKIIPVIATLATMNILLGVSKLMCGETIPYVKGNLPKDFGFLGRGDVGGVPIQLFLMIAAVVIFVLLQKKSIFGKYSIAIGGNQTAAQLAGINVKMIVWVLYAMVGCAAAFSGVIRASNMTIGDATAGMGFELDVIIAILMGGTSFFGGEGSVARTIAGAFILIILGIGMNQAGVPPFYQYVVKGMVLVLAVLLDKLVKEKISD